jgi:tetratricopeptide (TPR) repeat protein
MVIEETSFELKRHEKALQQEKASFSNNEHYEFVLVLNNLASILEDQGKYDDAVNNLEQMLVICDHIRLPSNHSTRALTHDNLGNIYATLKKYDLALKYQFEALCMRLKILLDGHLAFGGNLIQLGCVSILKKQFECARICLETVRAILSATVPGNHLMKAKYLLQFCDLKPAKTTLSSPARLVSTCFVGPSKIFAFGSLRH